MDKKQKTRNTGKSAGKINEVNKILSKVLLKIRPSKEEESKVAELTNSILEQLNRELKKINAVAIIGGSGAKKTWLAGNHDIDIFVKFDYEKYKNESSDISNILAIVLEKVFGKENVERIHGSRDYFNIAKRDFIIEIIPVLDINDAEKALNITDVSPMHADWVSWMVSKNKGIEDEIRLTKAFCRANNFYGAESYILGFSGYICEILTIYYGSFLNLLENAKNWEHGTVIDPRNYYENKAQIFEKLNKDKLRSPIIIIDPVQKDRNAAAALSIEKFNELKKAAKEFLESPYEEFFMKKEITAESLKKITGANKLLIIYAAPLKGKRDIAGGKLLKVFEFVKANIERNDFKLINSGWQWPARDFSDEKNDAMMWFIVKAEELSETVKRTGPPISAKEHLEDFKAKHGNKVVIEKNRAYAFVKREFRRPEELLEQLKKDNYIKERVKDLRIEAL